jgi:hypothetical protein
MLCKTLASVASNSGSWRGDWRWGNCLNCLGRSAIKDCVVRWISKPGRGFRATADVSLILLLRESVGIGPELLPPFVNGRGERLALPGVRIV